jgi:hypothetical protein
MKKVVSSYGSALCWVAASVVLAVIAEHFINKAKLPFMTDDLVRGMRVVTGSLFAAATLGRCGWSIQTWGGDSPAERWNTRIFRCLYLFGFGLLLLSFLIKPTIGEV